MFKKVTVLVILVKKLVKKYSFLFCSVKYGFKGR